MPQCPRRHLLASLLAAACAPRPTPVAAPETPKGAKARPPAAQRFRFRCDFWSSLHHALYDEGELKAKGEAPRRAPPAGPWAGSVDDYAREWSKRDLLFDDTMSDARAALVVGAAGGAWLEPDGGGGAGANMSTPPPGLPAGLGASLGRAAPAYREHFWASDRASAGRWVRALTPLLDAHAEALVAALERAFGARWPASPVAVDVVTRAGWGGAYTAALRHPGVTVGADDPRNQGESGLEIVFHEASHLLVNGGFRTRLARAFEARGVEPPRDLWHALLFFTVGEIVRRRLGPRYLPYADGQGLWARVPGWASHRAAFERAFLPFLDGRAEADAALSQIAERVAEARP